MLNDIISKVTGDINTLKFNTAISALMTFVNNIYQDKYISRQEFIEFLTLLYPFAPHFSEEMNERLKNKTYLCKSNWPSLKEDNSKKQIKLPVQINGKMKELIVIDEGLSSDEVIEKIKENEKLNALVSGGIKKVIYVQNKIINLIV